MTPALTTRTTIDTPAADVPPDARTLAGEHEALMRDVQRRAAPVLALLETRSWPHAELGVLTDFLRSTVLRQVSDEETLLYPHDSSAPPFAELSAEHVRLHALAARLEAAYLEPCSRTELRAVVEDLLTTLRRHLADEQDVLASLPSPDDAAVPSAAELAATGRDWLVDDAPVRIELDSLPASQARELCIERLLRLRPGQSAEVHARDDLDLHAVCRWIHGFDAARFGVSHETAGTGHVLRVSRRRDAR